ncbi:MAG: V-type ATPase subunit [Synergistaceae bacterium]|nr:V-type ATPase subunit [Synergistaceae bacterium]
MSSSTGSATALGVKAHVLYSRLLKSDEYWTLLNSNSTAEIASFLMQTEGYRNQLDMLMKEKVHRIDLENAVRSSVLAEAESFLFYLQGVWRRLFIDWLSWYESEHLKSIFRWIHSRHIDRDTLRKRLFRVPGSQLPYETLLNCRDYKELLEALRDTKYYAVLREPVRRLLNGESSLFSLEMAIDNLSETSLYNDIKMLPADERRLLEPLFGSRVDLLNLYHFHRCMWYYKMTIEETISRMLPVKYRVKAHHLREMAKGNGWEERISIMGEHFPAYGKIFRTALEQEDRELALEMSIKRYHHLKAFAILKNGIPGFHTAMAYFILKDHEVTDIIRMIEDVRYDYDRRSAAQYLIRPILNGGEPTWQ